VDPNKFAFSLCTVDGQKFNFGDAEEDFCLQSVSKVISYLIAVDEHGSEFVHDFVGSEPSGRNFNEIVLKPKPEEKNPNKKIPHNPCINAGAINCVSMIRPNSNLSDKFNDIVRVYEKMVGNKKIGFDQTVYLSEANSANRNHCLG